MGGLTVSRVAACAIAAALVFVWCVAAGLGGEITGVVKDDLSSPVAGASVSVRGGEAGMQMPVRARTDAAGVFRIAVPVGHYTVSIGSGRHNSERREVTVEGDAPVALDVRLRRVCVVRGRITLADGRPLAARRIHIRFQPTTEYSTTGITGPDGSYTLICYEPGTYAVQVTAPGYAVASSPGVQIRPGGEVTGLDFVLDAPAASIAGIVYDSDGKTPKPDAYVRARKLRPDGSEPFFRGPFFTVGDRALELGGLPEDLTARSGPNGEFLLDNAEEGTYRIYAQATGYAVSPAATDAVVGRSEKVAGVAVVLRAGSGISGTLYGVDGRPVVRTTVRVNLSWDEGSHNRGFGILTDERGRYALDALNAGLYEVELELDGAAPTKTEVQVDEGASVTGVDVRFSTGSALTALVIAPDGRPAAGVETRLWEPVERHSGYRTCSRGQTTDTDGKVRFEHLADGTYWVVASPTTAAPARAGPVAVQAGRPSPEARIELREGATIQGQVLDDRGSPVAGADVRWSDRTPRERGPSLLSSPAYQNSASTDAEGRFVVPRAAPGLWRFYAHPRGHLSGEVEADVGEQGTYRATVTVTRAWSGTLEGRIVKSDGRTPVADTRVTLERFITRNDRQWGVGTARVHTDADGRFSFDVQRAIHAVKFVAEDLTPTTVQIEPSDRETVSLSVRLPPVSGVRGTVRGDGAEIPADGLYVLAAPGGESVPLPDGSDPWPSLDCRSARVMPEETRWQILGLEPGEYEVFTYAKGRAPSVPAPVIVAEGDVAQVTVDVPPEPGAIAGRVLTVFGEPVEGAYASARPSGGRIRSVSTYMKTDEQGRYRIDGLTPGPVRIRAYTRSDGYAATPYEQTLVVSNQTTENVDFEMFVGAAVSGVVKRRDGWPLVGAYRIDLRMGEALRRTGRVREGGTFSFDRVYPGTYEVVLQRSGEMGLAPVAKQEDIAVGDEETITDIEFVIDEE